MPYYPTCLCDECRSARHRGEGPYPGYNEEEPVVLPPPTRQTRQTRQSRVCVDDGLVKAVASVDGVRLVEVTRDGEGLRIVTESVTIQNEGGWAGKELGSYEIFYTPSDDGDGQGSGGVYRAIHVAGSDHPHVADGGGVCYGRLIADMQGLHEVGDVPTMVALTIAVLRSYNRGDAYFDPFQTCGPCGGELGEDSSTCGGCDDSVCEHCLYYCENCDGALCANCRIICICEAVLCKGCAATCARCGDSVCPKCYDGGADMCLPCVGETEQEDRREREGGGQRWQR